MTASAQDVQQLADYLDIVEVCTRLHWCVDHRNWDALDDLLDDWVSFPTPEEADRPDFDPSRYLRSRADIKRAYPQLLGGLRTQHLIAGHHVDIDGDEAQCRAHSINVHVPEDGEAAGAGGDIVAHGNEYLFDLRRTPAGWRVVGRRTWIRWRCGEESAYDVEARLREWAAEAAPGVPSSETNQHEG